MRSEKKWTEIDIFESKEMLTIYKVSNLRRRKTSPGIQKQKLGYENKEKTPMQSHEILWNPTDLKPHAVPVVRQRRIFPLPVLQESHS